MPSPIAHSAAGYALYRLFRQAVPRAELPRVVPEILLLAATIFLSLLPDFDALIGVVAGDFAGFHNNATHSLFCGLLAAPIVGALMALGWRHSVAPRPGFPGWSAITLVCYELHVVMDYFTVGRGVMVLWPFSSRRYSPPMPLFHGVRWSEGWWTSEHFWTLLNELGWVALIVLAIHFRAPDRR